MVVFPAASLQQTRSENWRCEALGMHYPLRCTAQRRPLQGQLLSSELDPKLGSGKPAKQ